MLLHARHFHFGKNQLSGTIPTQLFSSNMILIHVLFEGNQLTGSIPSTLGLVQSLEVVRLDRNFLSGPVPSNLNNLINVSQLFLSNNKLTGPVPNLTGMNVLYSVDMSNNTFEASDVPPWFSTSQSLTTLIMEKTQLQGEVPKALFSLPNLQTVVLRSNLLSGTLDVGTSYSNHPLLIDLQANLIAKYRKTERLNISLILVDNPVCGLTNAAEEYCSASQTNPSYSTLANNCMPVPCSSDQISSPNCKCAYPYSGTLVFKAPSFSDLKNSSRYTSLEHSLMFSFQTHHLPVDSVSLSNLKKDSVLDYLELRLEVFPYGQYHFNRTGILNIGLVMSNQIFQPPDYFGPCYFFGDEYGNFAVYAFCQKRRAERATENNPFGEIRGYMDPEYYMTQQLTEKSDVYSFGVLMLELVTGRRPLERGKYIVREVRTAMDKTKDLYNLHEILDPAIGLGTTLKGLERFVDLAMRCVEELGVDRPTMGEVVKQIENIMQLAGLNPNAESTSISASYEGESKGNFQHPYANEASDNSIVFSSSITEPL
ncbi:hypothetical protein L1049_015403 [Liquidambar formosana]|uniref:Protein kinase domain-containing protein n=1 Tax=Liquidambar formosana TaxID=63359 RepID=A0AAP0RXI2_LIQFO